MRGTAMRRRVRAVAGTAQRDTLGDEQWRAGVTRRDMRHGCHSRGGTSTASSDNFRTSLDNFGQVGRMQAISRTAHKLVLSAVVPSRTSDLVAPVTAAVKVAYAPFPSLPLGDGRRPRRS
jgi:hypothetical protein